MNKKLGRLLFLAYTIGMAATAILLWFAWSIGGFTGEFGRVLHSVFLMSSFTAIFFTVLYWLRK